MVHEETGQNPQWNDEMAISDIVVPIIEMIHCIHKIRYRATATLWRPQIKQYTDSNEGRVYKTNGNIIKFWQNMKQCIRPPYRKKFSSILTKTRKVCILSNLIFRITCTWVNGENDPLLFQWHLILRRQFGKIRKVSFLTSLTSCWQFVSTFFFCISGFQLHKLISIPWFAYNEREMNIWGVTEV